MKICQECYNRRVIHHFEGGVVDFRPCPNPKCPADKTDLEELRKKWGLEK